LVDEGGKPMIHLGVMSSNATDRPEASRIIWTISRRLGMVIALALAFSLSAIVTVYMIFRIGDTRVPPVVGKTEVEAIRMAEKAGLKAKVQKRSDATTPENIVIETRPAPNSSVKKDSNLTIVVSSGPGQNRSQIKFAPEWPGAVSDNRTSFSGRPES